MEYLNSTVDIMLAKFKQRGSTLLKQGVLVPQPGTGRLDIRFSPTKYYGGLHCGQTFEVLLNGQWTPTRIEMSEDWYLVGVDEKDLIGRSVRI